MSGKRIWEELVELADECMERKGKERPEVSWLKERYREFMTKEGIRAKEEADRLLYERMYGEGPIKAQDTLKIRYWRTGRHYPINYRQCAAFGDALGLSREDMRFLLLGYYDSCDEIHEKPEDGRAVYWERRRAMEQLTERYLSQMPQERLEQMNITKNVLEHNMRHLYYTDALRYVGRPSGHGQYMERHITSVNYDSELGRNMKLLGVIPRKTMIRHLIILGMPGISLEWMNMQLRNFGYLELQEGHTLKSGESLDWLLIRLIAKYEKARENRSAQECCRWMQECCRILDTYFEEKGWNYLRFMYFKSLKE